MWGFARLLSCSCISMRIRYDSTSLSKNLQRLRRRKIFRYWSAPSKSRFVKKGIKNSKVAIKLILDVFGTNLVWYDNNIPCFFYLRNIFNPLDTCYDQAGCDELDVGRCTDLRTGFNVRKKCPIRCGVCKKEDFTQSDECQDHVKT